MVLCSGYTNDWTHTNTVFSCFLIDNLSSSGTQARNKYVCLSFGHVGACVWTGMVCDDDSKACVYGECTAYKNKKFNFSPPDDAV